MKISILTPSFNQGKFIEENILSVFNQNYPDIEHIIIDGGSTDNTVEILKKYPHLKWVSEKDEGQYDALRKGLAMSTGNIIGWINSDDYFVENIFYKINDAFNQKQCKWLIGNLITSDERINQKDNPVFSEISKKKLSRNPYIVRQPSAFYKKDFFVECGGVNPSFYMVADFDIWSRMIKKGEPCCVNEDFAVFRIHGNQKTSMKNLMIQSSEIFQICWREGFYLGLLSVAKKISSRFLRYYIKSFLISLKLIDPMYQEINLSSKKNIKGS